ncbi:MAG: outer membrane beta-barrel protein [Bradyrhizobium sp.]|nr:outer membrane beta-barrel protein [Bradyrhizobium sp.]
MKKILLGAAGLVAALGVVAPADAADLPARTYTKAPAMVAAIYDWSGFYIGINGGGGSSRESWNLTNLAGVPVAPAAGEGSHNATGGLVGGQLGYRWQSGAWVFGVEVQGDWADFKGSNVSQLPAFAGAVTNQTKLDAFGLFTGQVGYAWNNVLWYVKGGAAVTDNKFTGLTAGVVIDQENDTRWGGTVGTGLEVSFAPNWSVAFEYDHLFLGSNSVNFTAPGGGFTRTDSIKQDVDIGSVRVNYRWGGPVIEKY